MSSGNTTVPGEPPARSSSSCVDDRVLALAICQCLPEPEREGEVALFDPLAGKAWWILGRGVPGGAEPVHFLQMRPGETLDGGALRGNRISQEQLRITLEGDGLRLSNIGNARVWVDGAELPKGFSTVVREGAVIEIYEHSVFVVERRPRSMPAPHRLVLPLPRFGDVCRMGLGGESPDAYQQREEIALAAESDHDVLVFGETGTGKGVTAKAIHALSASAKGPFELRNCAELTPELAAVRLFGNVKGWPTPGLPATNGTFGNAVGGTAFLDEIGVISPVVQSVLLTAMETGYERVGEGKTRLKECRVIAATNMGEAGVKHDLRMRFRTTITCRPLRERPSDIAQVLRNALLQYARKDGGFALHRVKRDATGRAHVVVDASLIVNLLRHGLPGNVRQVEIIAEMAVREARFGGPLRWPGAVSRPKPATLALRKNDDAERTEDPKVAAEALLRGLGGGVRDEGKRERGAWSRSTLGRKPKKEEVIAALIRNQYHLGDTARDLGLSEAQLYRLRIEYGLHSPG